jgi:hypothetical protein
VKRFRIHKFLPIDVGVLANLAAAPLAVLRDIKIICKQLRVPNLCDNRKKTAL